jgi:O-antigen ligase
MTMRLLTKTFINTDSFPALVVLFSIAFFLVITPGHDIFSLIPSPYDEKRFTQILFISLVCLLIISSHSLRSSISSIINSIPVVARFCILTILILSIVSSYQAPAPNFAFLELTLYSGLVILALCLAAITVKNEKIVINTILFSLILYAAVYEVDFLASYIAALMVDGKLNTQIIHSGFANIRFFNQYQIWSLSLLCLPLFLYPNINKKLRIVLFIIGSFWITLLFATNSRGAVLSYFAALTITWVIYRGQAKPFIKINALYLFGGLIIYILLFVLPPYLFHSEALISNQVISTTSSSARLQLWSKALLFIQESPWLGIGPMHYAYYPNDIGAHPHNSVLQLAAEFGLPVAFLVISLFLCFLIAWIRDTPDQDTKTQTGHSNSPIVWIALFCSVISGLVYSQISGVIVTPMGQSMLALLIGLMAGVKLQNLKNETQIVDLKKTIFLPTLISSLTIIAMTYLVTPLLTERILIPFWGQNIPYHTVGPRFWRFGGIIQIPRPQ